MMLDEMVSRAAARIEAAARHRGVLGQASLHHLASGGGRWRVKLALVCADELGVAEADALAVAAACELVHQASVVHDDVQDNASLRRGQASVQARFGAAVAICVGDHLLMAAFRTLSEARSHAALTRLFADRISDMAAGQAEGFSPMLWPGMTRDRYISMVEAKAGAMIALPVEAAAILGGLDADGIGRAGRFARALGVAYQLTDDLADVVPDLARGELNGVLVEAVGSGDAETGNRLRVALAHAAETSTATSTETLPMALLQNAAGATLRWRDRRLAAAMTELSGHPLRQPLLDAALAFAPSLQASSEANRHAA